MREFLNRNLIHLLLSYLKLVSNAKNREVLSEAGSSCYLADDKALSLVTLLPRLRNLYIPYLHIFFIYILIINVKKYIFLHSCTLMKTTTNRTNNIINSILKIHFY